MLTEPQLITQIAAYFVLPSLLLVAAASDVASLKIPNWTSAVLAASFFPVAILAGLEFRAIGLHAAVGLASLGVGFLFFIKRWVGAGDVKLLAAIALWFGPKLVLGFLVATSVFGGILAVLILLMRYYVPMFVPGARLARFLDERGLAIPYGAALGAGALALYPQTEIFVALMSH